MKNMYFSGLGYRDPIAESDQIIWFLNQMSKPYKKGHLTAYWGNLKEVYTKSLLKMQAFELLQFLADKTTTEQQKRRMINKAKTKVRNQLELNNFLKESKERNVRLKLIKTISLN